MRRKLTRFAALGATAALVLAGCAQEDTETEPDDTAVEDDNGEDVEAVGLEDCIDNPNECNAGERTEGGDMTWVVTDTPDAWFPISAEGGSIYVLQGVTHGILPYTGGFPPDGEDFEYNMDLLASEPELLSDGEDEPFSWQIELNEDAEWDDGTPITADDFRALWYLSASEAEGHCEGCISRAPDSFDQIESIEDEDDGKTVIITLKEGEAQPEWFAFGGYDNIAGGIVPWHVAEEEGLDLEDPADVGEYFEMLHAEMPEFSGGPYQIVDGDLGNQIIKEPNENWYGETEPTLDTLITRFLTDEGAWVSAMQNREIDGVAAPDISEDVYNGLEDLEEVQVGLQPGPSWEHVDFNLQSEGLDDVELRRAMFTAIDVDEINERVYGAVFPEIEARTNHLHTADSPHHQDVVGDTQGSGDVDEAMSILEDAGYEMEDDVLTLDGEQVGPYRLRATSTPVRDTSTELIQSMLGDIGIEVELETTDALGETLASADYDIMLFGWSGSPLFVNTVAQMWQSESPSNFGGYENEEVDELITEMFQQSDLDEAADISNEIASIVAEDAYVLPLHTGPVYVAAHEEFVNVRDNTATSLRSLYNIEEWGLRDE